MHYISEVQYVRLLKMTSMSNMNFKGRSLKLKCAICLLCFILQFNECKGGCSCKSCCGLNIFGICTKWCYDNWNSWGGYSGCSRTCGGGTQTRYRYCPCGGTESQSQSCNTHCLNGGTYSGICYCTPWRVGICCQGKIIIRMHKSEVWNLLFSNQSSVVCI